MEECVFEENIEQVQRSGEESEEKVEAVQTTGNGYAARAKRSGKGY